MSDDEDRGTPPTVVGAIAAGVAPAPFLVTYSVVFILHGTVFPVDPPDITTTHGGEAMAGLVALLFLGVIVAGLGWFLSRRTRWPFLAGQLTTLGASIYFLVDSTSGEPEVPVVLALASATAVLLGCLPASWNWVSDSPERAARHTAQSADPVSPEPQGRDADSGPIDPNPGGGHGARAPRRA
jgi:hypothetical protein